MTQEKEWPVIVDQNRVYLTGFSMGGAGVYGIAGRWPDRFAALVAIAGYAPESIATVAERIRHIPIRIFHGESDKSVAVTQSRQLFAALKKLGGDAHYTEYAATHHGPAAEKVYAEPDLIPWLLAQHRPTHVSR